jgi:hypothetical protein
MPTEVGINYSAQQRKVIFELIKKKFSIDIAVAAVGKYMKLWGFQSKSRYKNLTNRTPKKRHNGLKTLWRNTQESNKKIRSVYILLMKLA